MGGGISMCFANAGIPVSMVERDQEALDRGLATIRRNYENTAARGGFTAEQVEERLGLIDGTLDLEAAREADLVVEAVFEELGIKQETFRRLDALAPAHDRARDQYERPRRERHRRRHGAAGRASSAPISSAPPISCAW